MSLKKIIVTSAAAALVTTSLLASGSGTAMVVPNDKTGDYLLAPEYTATTSGWSTNLRVVNTNTTASVIAKVVIREQKNSIEMRDFAIYLTPGDVFECDIAYDPTDSVIKITSTDDSMIFTDPTDGVVKTGAEKAGGWVINFPTKANTEPERGYIEIWGAAKSAFIGALADTTVVDLGKAPVNKHHLYAAYTAKNDAGVYANFAAIGTSPDEAEAVTRWVPVGANDLTGQVVLGRSDALVGNIAMTYVTTALENATGNNVADPANVTTGKDTLLIDMTSKYAALPKGDQFIAEYEAAINKNGSYVVNYADASGTAAANTELVTTFPTKKYRHNESTARTLDEIFYLKPVADRIGLSSDGFMRYAGVPRDMEEHTPDGPVGGEISGDPDAIVTHTDCDKEVCRIDVDAMTKSSTGFNSPDGYVTVDISGMDTGDVASVAIMPYDSRVQTIKVVGGANVTNMITPAFY